MVTKIKKLFGLIFAQNELNTILKEVLFDLGLSNKESFKLYKFIKKHFKNDKKLIQILESDGYEDSLRLNLYRKIRKDNFKDKNAKIIPINKILNKPFLEQSIEKTYKSIIKYNVKKISQRLSNRKITLNKYNIAYLYKGGSL